MSDEYPLMAFIANEGVAPKGERYDRSALVTDTVNKLYKKTEKGDFIYSSNNLETGSIGLNKYGKACISPVYSIFEPTGIADSDFLGRRLVRKDFINAMVKWRQGVIYGQWRIHESDFLKIEISVPSVEEQRKIGAYLDQLDNLITLHQRQPFLHSTPDISLIVQLTLSFYTFSWEQRKLGDISEIKTGPFGSTLHADDYVSDGIPIITTEHFKTGALPRSKNGLPQVSDADYKRLTSYTLNDGDIVFSRVGSVDINALITPFQSNWLFSGRVLRVRPRTDISSQFLHTRLETESIKSDIRARAVGQTMPSINTEILKITPLVLPTSAAEQEQIGSYFAAIDNLITLHQRKFEKLTNVKKSMLEKMFPQNGSSYPEIRFKGFTDPWEQRKLGDIGKARSGVGFPDADQGGLTGVPFFKVSDMNSDGNENEMTVANNYVTAEQIADHRWSPITELPAIFFAKVGAAVMLNRKRLCRFPFLLDNNTMAYSLSPTKWDADFAKALFGTVDLTSLVQVGALPSYNAGDVESMEIYLPSLLEQEQIGAYFNHLDNLITLHQRELEKLQNIKKSMLEKMFV